MREKVVGTSKSKYYSASLELWKNGSSKTIAVTEELRKEWRQAREEPSLALKWIRAYQLGEPGAVQALYFIYFPFLMRAVVRYGKKAYNANLSDCLQEAFIGLLEGCARYDVELYGHLKPLTFLTPSVKTHVRMFLANFGEVVFPISWSSTPSFRLSKNLTVCFTEMDLSWTDDMEEHYGSSIVDENIVDTDDVLSEAVVEKNMPALAAWILNRLTELRYKTSGASYRNLSDYNGPFLAAILRKRFFERQELTKIGKEMDLSRERIRQLEMEALTACRTIAGELDAFPEDFATFDAWIRDLLEEFLKVGSKKDLTPVTIKVRPVKKKGPLSASTFMPDLGKKGRTKTTNSNSVEAHPAQPNSPDAGPTQDSRPAAARPL